MLLFAALALYLTALWNKGFVYSPNWLSFLELTVLLALMSYLIIPLSKIVLFPVHLLTFGLLSVGGYMLLFYFVGKYTDIIAVDSWVFSGFSLGGMAIQKVSFSQMGNLFVSALSISAIINTLEKIT